MKPLWIVVALAAVAFVALRWRRLGWLERGIGIVVAVGAAVYSTGVVHLPNVEHLIEDLGRALGPWTYLLVGAMAFLETGAFVGLIAPGETTILVGGVVAGQGEINLLALIGLVWACAVAGDVTSFLLGRKLGREFLERHGPKVKITHERLLQVERFFDRHGGKAVLIGRFVGLIRALAPFIAGSSKMPLRRFLPYDVIGAGLWGTTFCLLGYVFWQSFGTVADYAGRGAFALGTTIVVIVGTYVAVKWVRQPANRHQAHAWLHEQAERPLLRPLARVVRPVVYRGIVPAAHQLAGPARFTWNRLTPGDLGLEVTTLLAIAAVGSYGFFALALSVGPGEPLLFSDRRAYELADELHTPTLIDVAEVLTYLGSSLVVGPLVLAAALLLVRWRRWFAALTLVVSTVLVFVANNVAKAVVDRPRPEGSLVETSGMAYPSGHAAYAVAWVAVAVLLLRYVPWLAGRAVVVIVAVAVVLVVAATRVYLHAHWQSDVVGGIGLAATIYAVCGVVALLVSHVRQNQRRA